ncbi:hypothetical protein [Natrinema halophilum]|uniref:hypothetical protein n=1 Tax=Natrinema halophilum TaxID=1699371 RepID=UPI001F3E2528|nr:hypothetical protein [Natrinema halophilum]UHQ96005.1 hypothetical protein HYG82_21240 [Natrinema halophilum]
MDSHPDEAQESAATATHGVTRRRFGVLFAVGFLGIVALAATTPAQLETIPDASTAPPAVIAAVVIVQSSILLAIAVLVGLYTAHRLGLRSSLLERASDDAPLAAALRADFPVAASLGAATGVVLVLMEAIVAPTPAGGAVSGGAEATVGAVLSSIPVRFLYGGLTE